MSCTIAAYAQRQPQNDRRLSAHGRSKRKADVIAQGRIMSDQVYVVFYVTSTTGEHSQKWAINVYLNDHWEICWTGKKQNDGMTICLRMNPSWIFIAQNCTDRS